MKILQRLSTFTLSVALVATALGVSFALPLPAHAAQAAQAAHSAQNAP
jgi:ABC-type phosphate/phosphonate transport system permease subunit